MNPLLPVLILGAAGGLFLALLYVVTMILVVFRD